MNSKVYVYKVTCPDCGTIHYGFVGNDEDASFYCNETIEIKKGNKTTTEKCGYYTEKMRHLPESSCVLIKTVKIEDVIQKV